MYNLLRINSILLAEKISPANFAINTLIFKIILTFRALTEHSKEVKDSNKWGVYMKKTVANTHKEEYSTSAFFQFICMAITSIMLFGLIYKATVTFKTFDEMPELLPITPKLATEFSGTGKVKVGLQIANFSIFDVLANNFAFAGTVWFEFDPSITSLDTIGKFSFEKGDIKFLAAPNTRIIKGKLFARYDVKVDMKDNLNYKYFPFSDHTIFITLDNNYVSPAEMIFESAISDFVISKGLFVSGWKEYDKHVYTGYSLAQLEQNNKETDVYRPRTIFSIDYKFSGIRQILTILLPIILIFFITLFTFAMEPVNYDKSILTLSSGSVTALLAYRFVIENLSPKGVGYFMLSDLLFFIFLTMTFLVFFLNTRTLNFNKRAKQFFTIAIDGFVVLSVFYLFNFW